MTEPLLQVIYNGLSVIVIDEAGKPQIDTSNMAKGRLNPAWVDMDSTILQKEIKRLREVEKAALCNPYREALGDLAAICKAIPKNERAGMRNRDIQAVLTAVVRVAAKTIQ